MTLTEREALVRAAIDGANADAYMTLAKLNGWTRRERVRQCGHGTCQQVCTIADLVFAAECGTFARCHAHGGRAAALRAARRARR